MSAIVAYRADIDGLRAIAVSSVVLCHAEVSAFSGGYVGVDVFFVISGFLITNIIQKEIAAGRFSLAGFYSRRIMRILPAFTAMAAIVLAASLVVFTPNDLRNVGMTTLAAALSLSNIAFWRSAGYFDTSSAEKPLLHTWSLGVEEQFYMLFPLVMIATSLYLGRYRLAVIILLLLGSLALCLVSVFVAPNATFYLMPTRAWELLAGGLVAFLVGHQSPAERWSTPLGLVGLALILVPVALYDSATRFPGPAALAPVAGAMLVIFSGARSPFVSRILSIPILVWIGWISYSLYLWHHPIFAFYRYLTMEPFTLLTKVGLICLSLIAAALSWRYVERPFRRPVSNGRRGTVFALGGASVVVLCGASLILMVTGGLPQRFKSPDRERIAANEAIAGEWPYPDRCGNYSLNAFAANAPIRYCRPDEIVKSWSGSAAPEVFRPRRLILAWGDSNMEQLYPAFLDLNRSDLLAGRQIVMATYGGCPPLMGVNSRTPGFHCGTFNRSVQQRSLEADVDTVVIGASWTGWMEGWPEKAGDNNLCAWPGPCTPIKAPADRMRFLRTAFATTLEPLVRAGKKIVIVLPFPTYDKAVAPYLARSAALGWKDDEHLSAQGYRNASGPARQLLFDVASAYDAKVVDPRAILCSGEACPAGHHGMAWYRDANHVSIATSKTMQDAILTSLADAGLTLRDAVSTTAHEGE